MGLLNRRKFLKFGTVIVLLLFSSVGSVSLSLLASVQAATSLQSNQRILIKGTRFVFEDGSPFLFLGGNLAFYRFVVQRGEIYSQTEVDEVVSNLATYTGAKMTRVGLAGGAFEPTLGNYDDRAFTQLDYVLAAARRNGIRVIIALRDYAWNPWPRDLQDPYWLLGGGTTSKPNKDAILVNADAKEAYKRFIGHVLDRVNSVTGQRYRDDSTVFAWDLLNDANFTDKETLSSWVTEISGYIRKTDSVHFLTISAPDAYQKWYDPGEGNWRVFANPAIDYISLHYYAPPDLYDPVDASNVAKIKTRVKTGLQFGKPVVFDEFGVEGTGPSLQARVNLYRTVMETVLANGGSGALFWSWGPLGPNGWGGLSNSGGWDVYVNQRKELADVVLAEAILWTGYKPVAATTTMLSTSQNTPIVATPATPLLTATVPQFSLTTASSPGSSIVAISVQSMLTTYWMLPIVVIVIVGVTLFYAIRSKKHTRE